jgi:quercetin dioxygenase-like cupin family protein
MLMLHTTKRHKLQWQSNTWVMLAGKAEIISKQREENDKLKTNKTMKKMMKWMFAATLICGATTISLSLNSCKEAQAQEDNPAPAQQVQSTELIRTSQSWDGVELPDYLQGRPELVAVKYEFPAGQKLGWHHHPVMNYGILVQGELTIIGQDGKEKTVHEGEAVVEMVNTIHHGENRGSKPVILYMFYLSQEGMPLAVQHPEIPLY